MKIPELLRPDFRMNYLTQRVDRVRQTGLFMSQGIKSDRVLKGQEVAHEGIVHCLYDLVQRMGDDEIIVMRSIGRLGWGLQCRFDTSLCLYLRLNSRHFGTKPKNYRKIS